VTEEGERVLETVQPVVLSNRTLALRGLSEDDLTVLRGLLERIYANCSSPTSSSSPKP
jgi:DNA-binding MarR family transcriptional regulator